ncbi:hypothetical protein ACXJJ3_37795 [Kribbella sp. WER1]
MTLDPAKQRMRAAQLGRHRVRLGVTSPARAVEGSQSALWDVLTELLAQARSEIASFDDTNYLLAAGVPESIQQRGPAALRAAVERGARVRQVTSRAGLLADQARGTIIYRAGGEARVVDAVPSKMLIIDRRTALLPLNSTVLAGGFQIIHDPQVVSVLLAVHQQSWEAGSDARRLHRDLPPPHLAAIVPALASGEPDEVVAPRLGLSSRTYSRRVAEFLKGLGVHSRFQAGAEATRRGWL